VSDGQVKGRICWGFLWLWAEFSDLTYKLKFILVTTQDEKQKSNELFKCVR